MFAHESLHGWAMSIRSMNKELDPADHERTHRATEAWTDDRHATDDKYVELYFELAVALANATAGAARSTVLKVTQVEPRRGFVAWQALVDGHAPKSPNDPADYELAVALARCNHSYWRLLKDARTQKKRRRSSRHGH